MANLKNIILNERIQTKKLHIIQVHLCDMSRKGKSVETENSKWLLRAWGEGSRTSLGMGFGGDRNVVKLDCGDDNTTLYKY